MSPNPTVTVTFDYDDDPAGAADALLAVLRPVIRRAELADEATEDPDDEETAA